MICHPHCHLELRSWTLIYNFIAWILSPPVSEVLFVHFTREMSMTFICHEETYHPSPVFLKTTEQIQVSWPFDGLFICSETQMTEECWFLQKDDEQTFLDSAKQTHLQHLHNPQNEHFSFYHCVLCSHCTQFP